MSRFSFLSFPFSPCSDVTIRESFPREKNFAFYTKSITYILSFQPNFSSPPPPPPQQPMVSGCYYPVIPPPSSSPHYVPQSSASNQQPFPTPQPFAFYQGQQQVNSAATSMQPNYHPAYFVPFTHCPTGFGYQMY